MTNDTQKLKRPTDMNQLSKLIVDIATGQVKDEMPSTKDKRFVKSGSKGGKVRAEVLSSARRTEIAKKAAKKRWDNTEIK